MPQTVAPRWKVRDVAAHLLDVDLRRIAVARDGHFAPMQNPPANESKKQQEAAVKSP